MSSDMQSLFGRSRCISVTKCKGLFYSIFIAQLQSSQGNHSFDNNQLYFFALPQLYYSRANLIIFVENTQWKIGERTFCFGEWSFEAFCQSQNKNKTLAEFQ